MAPIMGRQQRLAGPLMHRLLEILEEPPPTDSGSKHRLFCELLELEEAARAASIEQWLLDEIQVARETAGEAMLLTASEILKH
ncbi:hypothetical protein [Methylobacterium durans]|uniref:Uncharacterized protein n=1 Tax=Methylobacterium durans TaxID=2202825 RepID=A0A2U8W1Y4_9HYPH|nr:hypothetical protein [Methylobacterium durans]AWN40079.1 hypothetical protein DK389_05390 [Methylobacterium durans]